MNHTASPSMPSDAAPREHGDARSLLPDDAATTTRRAVYCVWPFADPQGAAWWVRAASTREARQLVALNVPEARHAWSSARFGCSRDDGDLPPEGVISSALSETETVIVVQP